MMSYGSCRVDPQTIVVAVDGSQESDAALEWAISEAQATDRRLVLVHVTGPSEAVIGAPLAAMGVWDPTSHAKDLLHRASSRCKLLGVRHSTAMVYGSTPDSLSELSAPAAMLVLGARRRRRGQRALGGSVSEACVRRSACPVMVVKGPRRPDR